MIRTEASISVTLAWDPRKPLEERDRPVLAQFLAALRQLTGCSGVKVHGPVTMLAGMVGAADNIPRTLGEIEQETIAAALARNGGHQTRTAQDLGVSVRGLRYKLDRYGLKGDRDGRSRSAA